MSEISFLSIADNNCWIVYIMLFETVDRTNYDLVNTFQQNVLLTRFLIWDGVFRVSNMEQK